LYVVCLLSRCKTPSLIILEQLPGRQIPLSSSKIVLSAHVRLSHLSSTHFRYLKKKNKGIEVLVLKLVGTYRHLFKALDFILPTLCNQLCLLKYQSLCFHFCTLLDGSSKIKSHKYVVHCSSTSLKGVRVVEEAYVPTFECLPLC